MCSSSTISMLKDAEILFNGCGWKEHSLISSFKVIVFSSINKIHEKDDN